MKPDMALLAGREFAVVPPDTAYRTIKGLEYINIDKIWMYVPDDILREYRLENAPRPTA